MNFEIALLLGQDGITNGFIYALLALALVLAFAVTRVIFIPQGEFVAYGALTLVALQAGKLPGTLWLTGQYDKFNFAAQPVVGVLHGLQQALAQRHVVGVEHAAGQVRLVQRGVRAQRHLVEAAACACGLREGH